MYTEETPRVNMGDLQRDYSNYNKEWDKRTKMIDESILEGNKADAETGMCLYTHTHTHTYIYIYIFFFYVYCMYVCMYLIGYLFADFDQTCFFFAIL